MFSSGAKLTYENSTEKTAQLRLTKPDGSSVLYTALQSVQLLGGGLSSPELRASTSEQQQAAEWVVRKFLRSDAAAAALLNGPSSQASLGAPLRAPLTTETEIEIEVSESQFTKANQILEEANSKGLFGLIDLQQISQTIHYGNDNIFLGSDLGNAVGSHRGKGLQGNDESLTALLRLTTVAQYSNGSIGLLIDQDLYAKLVTVNGQTRDANGKYYAKNINFSLVQIAARRDFSRGYFVVLTLGFATLDDQEGFLQDLQQRVHERFGLREYRPIDFMRREQDEVASVMLGRTVTFFKSGETTVTGTFAAGPSLVHSSSAKVDHGPYVSSRTRQGIVYDTNVTIERRGRSFTVYASRNPYLAEKGARVCVPTGRVGLAQLKLCGGVFKARELGKLREFNDTPGRHNVLYDLQFKALVPLQ